MFDTDPISQLITRTQAQADVTATQAPQVAPQRTIGPAPTRAPQAKPVGGALGALYSAGESVHNGIVERLQTGPKQSDAVAALALAFPEFKGIGRAVAGLAETKALPVAYEGTASLFPAMMERHAAGGISDETLASLRSALPGSPVPGVRAAQSQLPWKAASQASAVDTEALRNMMETGFAGGKTAAMVELPASGAGRAGSTATAMKTALQTTPPAQFRTLVEREIARRGGATAPEVEMAATEEVARRLASGMR